MNVFLEEHEKHQTLQIYMDNAFIPYCNIYNLVGSLWDFKSEQYAAKPYPILRSFYINVIKSIVT